MSLTCVGQSLLRLLMNCAVCFLPALSCLVLSCLVLSCLVLSCLVLSCLVLSCLVLSCLVLSCLVLLYEAPYSVLLSVHTHAHTEQCCLLSLATGVCHVNGPSVSAVWFLCTVPPVEACLKCGRVNVFSDCKNLHPRKMRFIHSCYVV